jgi:hypothetical protein
VSADAFKFPPIGLKDSPRDADKKDISQEIAVEP